MDSLFCSYIPGYTGFIFKHVSPPMRLDEEIAFRIAFLGSPQSSLNRNVEVIERLLHKYPIAWIATGSDEWVFDLGKLRESNSSLATLDWLKGKAYVRPELETIGRDSYVVFYMTPDFAVQPPECLEILKAIEPSLRHFKEDHPVPLRVAFVMMKFGDGQKHQAIFDAIKEALSPFGIAAVRADDVTSLFRATCGVSLGDRERTQNERQAVYHGRQDSDLTSGGQWPSGLGCLSRT